MGGAVATITIRQAVNRNQDGDVDGAAVEVEACCCIHSRLAPHTCRTILRTGSATVRHHQKRIRAGSTINHGG